MTDFSTISQDPTIRAIVQDGLLERNFHDAMYPRLLFRGEALPILWPNQAGDNMVFTGRGLMAPQMQPLAPNTDPTPSSYLLEQWSAQLHTYADTIDTAMPNSIVAIANLFLSNAHTLGLGAAMTLNRLVRNKIGNAACAGQTVIDGTLGSGTVIRVKHLNGFTTARRPDLVNGSQVQYAAVSTSNPLKVLVGASLVANTVVGYTPDNPGDELGPGTVTLGSATAVTDRDPFLSVDRTYSVYVGGGTRTDDIGNTDLLTLAAIRAAVARFRTQNVPAMPDGRYHAHIDPVAEGQIFGDAEFGRLLTSLPDYYMYKDFAIGSILGTVFFRNSENPLVSTVYPGDGVTYSLRDNFAGALYSNDNATTGDPIHRTLFLGAGAIMEYYQDLSGLITEAGVTGRVGQSTITNNGIDVNTDRIQLILRAPLNRMQDMVAASYKFVGDWPIRTDGIVGDGARVKRIQQIVSGE